MNVEIIDKRTAKIKLNRNEVFDILRTALLQPMDKNLKDNSLSIYFKENYGFFVNELLAKGFEFDSIQERIQSGQFDNEYLDEIIITLYKKTEAKNEKRIN